MDIFREYTFEAAHRLTQVPTGHKCFKLHGHTYRVRLTVSGPVKYDGMVLDFAEIDAAFEPLLRDLDHHYLNEIHQLSNPTSENLALWLWNRLAGILPLTEVLVQETGRSGVVYRGES